MTTTDTKEQLPLFEGQPVQQAAVRITRAGDGLSEALRISPHALELGDEVHYVLRGAVRQINHRQKDDDEPLVRVHTVEAVAITEIDAEIATKLLTAAAEELARQKAEAEGQLAFEAEQAAEEREAED